MSGMVLALSTWICNPIERAAIPTSLIVLSAYCARAARGHAAAALPRHVMNSRRLTRASEAKDTGDRTDLLQRRRIKSPLSSQQDGMSALLPKADMCGATCD